MASCEAYQESSGKQLLLLVDTTFAPASEVLGRIGDLGPELGAMVFVSMSKSVSRGETTAGALVAYHTSGSQALLHASREVAEMLDVTARQDQMLRLCRNHVGVEERCERAYENMVSMADVLRGAVMAHTGHDMPVTMVGPEHAAQGFTSSTFSFNLPAPAGATPEVKAALAQRFVDLLTKDAERFKPCVSFGGFGLIDDPPPLLFQSHAHTHIPAYPHPRPHATPPRLNPAQPNPHPIPIPNRARQRSRVLHGPGDQHSGRNQRGGQGTAGPGRRPAGAALLRPGYRRAGSAGAH